MTNNPDDQINLVPAGVIHEMAAKVATLVDADSYEVFCWLLNGDQEAILRATPESIAAEWNEWNGKDREDAPVDPFMVAV